MKLLNYSKARLMLLVFVAAIVFFGGSVKADFTFGEPENLGPTVNSSDYEWGPSFSADYLEMFFISDRPDGFGNWDIWVTTRETVDDDWGTPINLGPPVNSSYLEHSPAISADGLEFYFCSTRPGGIGHEDIWVTRRESKDDTWGPPVNLGQPANSSTLDYGMCISEDGLELYFNSLRPGGVGSQNHDLYVMRRAAISDDWGAPANLGSVVNGPSHDIAPSLSTDGLCLFFSDHPSPYYIPHVGGLGLADIWVTTRATIDDDWGEVVNLGPNINTSGEDCYPRISPDGSTLYFVTGLPGGYGQADIWKAPITPIVDFNGDCKLDCSDICDLLEHWNTDNPLYDIGPMPWGDGIVDMKDLEVFISYWEQQEHDTSLLAYWKLDETQGTIAYDSADCHDGTWHDGPGSFNGIDDYVSTPFVLNPAETDFSVSLWVKATSPGQTIFSQIATANWLSLDRPNGRLVVDVSSAGIGFPSQPLVADVVIADNLWHQIVLACDDMGRSVYIDGMLVATDMQTELVDCNTGFYIGCGKNREVDSFFAGGIKDVKIYNRAVTP